MPVIISFIKWWLVRAPHRIFNVLKRITILSDSMLSFSMNVRLIFTPLFGDYSIVGRLVGFFTRLLEIVAGLAIQSVLGIVTLTGPIMWWLLPLICIEEFKGYSIIIFAVMVILWYLTHKDTPETSVSRLVKRFKIDRNDLQRTSSKYQAEEVTACFRPATLAHIDHLSHNWQQGLNTLITAPLVSKASLRAEINTTEFLTHINDIPVQLRQAMIKQAFEYAVEFDSKYVEIEHLWASILTKLPNAELLLQKCNTSIESIKTSARWTIREREDLSKMFIWQEDYEMLFTGGIGKGMTGRLTKYLDNASEDFTRQVLAGRTKKVVGREKEIKKIADLLSASKDNILIIGPPGSGKTTLVKGIAYKIIEGVEYKAIKNQRIVSLQLSGIISGTKSKGEIADKVEKIFEDIEGSGDIIVFIDEIHTLAGSAQDSTLFSILEPKLSSGNIKFIGATTIQNYRKYIEPNGSFSRLFQIVEIGEATKDDTIKILMNNVTQLEQRHKKFITYPAIKAAVTLSEKLIHERVLPDKAIDILTRATASTNETIVTSECIAKEISEVTHVPVEKITEDEAKRLLEIDKSMKKTVIGQDNAINQIASALKRARTGIRNESKPIASFLFVGTTGVGKTQTAKALAKAYFGNSKDMIRLDMSEYQQLDSMDKLIGSPDGSTRGILTESVRTRPFALILLDEIEKAHPNILLTFLQVLDDARLTDSSGNVVDFSNTIIIATSNVGTRAIQELYTTNSTFEDMKTSAMKEVRDHFAPEFLNRFSGIIVFNPLSKEDVAKITVLLLQSVSDSSAEKGIKLEFTQDLVDELVKRGYNPEWGARPMARLIEDTVESYVATKILTGELAQGSSATLGLDVFETQA